MAVSRWERGEAEPPADAYIRLGNIADDPLCWFFWGRAGLSTADVMRVLPTASRRLRQGRIALSKSSTLAKRVRRNRRVSSPFRFSLSGQPLLASGEEVPDLDQLKPEAIWAAPAEWCPNPAPTISLRVRAIRCRR